MRGTVRGGWRVNDEWGEREGKGQMKVACHVQQAMFVVPSVHTDHLSHLASLQWKRTRDSDPDNTHKTVTLTTHTRQ